MKLLLKKVTKLKKSIIKVSNKKNKEMKKILSKKTNMGKKHRKIKKNSFKAMLLRPIKFIIGYGLVYYQVRNLESITLKNLNL